jgi:hypothetical protein
VAGITVLYKQWLNLPLVMDIFGNKWAADEEWEKHRCEKWQQQLLRIWIYGLEHWLMSLFQRSKIRVAIRLIAAGGKTQVAKRRWQNAGGKTQVAKHGAVNLWLTARGAENRQLRWEHYNKPILCQKWRVNKPQIRGIYKLLKTKNGAF